MGLNEIAIVNAGSSHEGIGGISYLLINTRS